MASNESVGDQLRVEKPPMVRLVAVVIASSAVEWFDFFIYTTAAALFFGPLFFPSLAGGLGVLASFATLAVGFVARPLGGIIAGNLGDKWGRKPTLMLSIVLMGVTTSAIGLLPTYASVGIAAPVLLVIFRLLQGLAVGGQWGGASLLLTEYAPAPRRGFFGSFVQVGAIIGSLAGSSIFLLLSIILAEDALLSWGWRVPFLSGLLLVAVGLYLHRSIEDTPVFKRLQQQTAGQARQRPPVFTAIRNHWRIILCAGGSFVLANGTYYIVVAGLLDYGTRQLELPRTTILGVVLAAAATQLIFVPSFAALSDRIGRRRLFMWSCVLLGLWATPMFALIDTASPTLIFVALLVCLLFHSMMFGPQVAFYSELFSAEVRYSGASLGYQLGTIVGGGLSPFAMSGLLLATSAGWSVALYMIGLAAISFLSVYLLQERKDYTL